MDLARGLAELRIRSAVNGMLQAIRDAANPAYPEWSPYRGNVTNIAVFYVKHVVRELRKAGLYVDADLRRAA